MILKSCPFCGSQISFDLNNLCGTCLSCAQKGIIIKIYGKSYDEIVSKWNDRDFDNKFLNNIDYLYEYAKFLKGECSDFSDEHVHGEILQIQSDLSSCGCVIYENGEIEEVKLEHDFILMRLLGINDRKLLPVENDEIYNKLNLVKVTFLYKYISCLLPERITRNQLDSLELFLIKNSNWCESFEFTNAAGKNNIKLYKIEEACELIKGFRNGKKIYTI